MRPTMQCHRGLRRGDSGDSWKAPRMVNTPAPMMCNTTGKGAAKNRAFAGVISAPTASWVSRMPPATTGTTLSATTRPIRRRCLIVDVSALTGRRLSRTLGCVPLRLTGGSRACVAIALSFAMIRDPLSVC